MIVRGERVVDPFIARWASRTYAFSNSGATTLVAWALPCGVFLCVVGLFERVSFGGRRLPGLSAFSLLG